MRRAASPPRGEGQTAKAYLPASNALSSLKSVTTTPRSLVCRTSSPSFFLGLAVGGRVRLSPSTVRPFAASGPRVRGHSRFCPAAYGPRAGPPVGAALHSPSTQTRTPGAFLRGGGRLCFQAFSTPHLRYVFPCTTLCFLYLISFTNGSVYRGIAVGSPHNSVRLHTSVWEKSPPLRRGSADSSKQRLQGFCSTTRTFLPPTERCDRGNTSVGH